MVERSRKFSRSYSQYGVWPVQLISLITTVSFPHRHFPEREPRSQRGIKIKLGLAGPPHRQRERGSPFSVTACCGVVRCDAPARSLHLPSTVHRVASVAFFPCFCFLRLRSTVVSVLPFPSCSLPLFPLQDLFRSLQAIPSSPSRPRGSPSTPVCVSWPLSPLLLPLFVVIASMGGLSLLISHLLFPPGHNCHRTYSRAHCHSCPQ